MKFLRNTRLMNSHSLMRTSESRKTIMGSYKNPLRDIYGDSLMTPHEEMEKISTAADRNTFFESSINTSTDFIMGKEFMFKGDDEFSNKQIELYLKQIEFDENAREQVKNTIKYGNGYLEQDFINPMQTGDHLIPNRLYTVPDSSQIYINCDAYGEAFTEKVVTPNGEVIERPNYREFYLQRIQNILVMMLTAQK